MKRIAALVLFICVIQMHSIAQINTDRVLAIGRNALYFEDYVLSIQYFNQIIKVKPHLADPYMYRAIAKLSLEDYKGADEDCSLALDRNPFLVTAYQVRGIARQNLKKYQEAIDDYAKGLTFLPENTTFLMNKAIAEMQSKQYDDAAQSFEQLIAYHPSYYNAQLSYAHFLLERGDTINGLLRIEKAIDIDKNYASAYALRAMVTVRHNKDYRTALDDMNRAVRLEPSTTSHLMNRALVRYYLNDLRGAMSDYDLAISLESNNVFARYNRGLLRSQIGDRNRAIEDFSVVIDYEPDNYFAVYNRAVLRDETGDLLGAISDYSVVLGEYTDFLPGYYARSEARRKLGDKKGAEDDFMKVLALENEAASNRRSGGSTTSGGNTTQKTSASKNNNTDSEKETRSESDRNIQKFNRLIVADNNGEVSKYDSQVRGRVQDKNSVVMLEPQFVYTYYENPDAITPILLYDKNLLEFNRQHLLSQILRISNSEQPLSEEQITHHFESINRYSKQLEENNATIISYFARSLDFMLVQDYDASLEDLNKVIMLSPRFSFAYFNRAVVRYRRIEYSHSLANEDQFGLQPTHSEIGALGSSSKEALQKNAKMEKARSLEYELVLRDYDKVLEYDPKSVFAYYNRANIRCALKDYKSALLDLNAAIALAPDFGHAYYNRGLVYLYLGDNAKSEADLSKAGELGIVAAYSVMKRMSN